MIQISDEMAAFYRREGWVKVPQALSLDDIAIIRYAVERAETEVPPDRIDLTRLNSAEFETSDYIKSIGQVFRNETDLRLYFPELDPIIAKMSRIAARLMGEDEVRVLEDQTFMKPPARGGGRPTPWHQDFCYYPLDRRGLLAIWVPLQPVTPENGSLKFVPRSHLLGPLGRTAGQISGDLANLLTPYDRTLVDEPVSNNLAVGDVTVHNGMTLHAAGVNNGDTVRAAWNALFIPASTRYTGAPCGHRRLNDAGLTLLGQFDDESFRVRSA